MTWLWTGLTGLQTAIELIIDTDLRLFGHIRKRPTQRPSESLPTASLRLRYDCALQRDYTDVHYDVQAHQMWLRPLTLEGIQSLFRGQKTHAMHVTEAIFATS